MLQDGRHEEKNFWTELQTASSGINHLLIKSDEGFMYDEL